MTNPPAIAATGLCKSFGAKVVLDHLDLTVEEGTIFSLLGPNGAGKTTVVQILSTLLPPDAGRVHVAGADVVADADRVRRAIGVTGQFSAVDGILSGQQNLQLMADLHHLGRRAGRRRVAELLERFDLVDAAHRPASTYSGGMRRRLDLAMTLIGSPRLIFLDEPTTGLDPRSRRSVWDSVRELASQGVTIFLTTQHLDEADQLAGRVAVMDGGRIVAEGTPAELKRSMPGGHIELRFAATPFWRAAVDLLGATTCDAADLTVQVPDDGHIGSLRRLLGQLEEAHLEVEHLAIHAPDLDDVFFAVTGHPTGAGQPRGGASR